MDRRDRHKLSILIITGFLLASMVASLVEISPVAMGQGYDYGGANQPLGIRGLDGLQGFTAGENQVSLATHMVSQDQGKSYFEVVGFSVANPYSGQATVYSLKAPMMGVFDTAANTMQIDMSQLAVSVSGAGVVDRPNVYNVLRSDASIFIIDMTMYYQGTYDYRTLFSVTAISMIAPDGTVTAFTLDQAVQLVIDTVTYRMSVPTFPQLADSFNSYYANYDSGYYTSVEPVIYQQPVYVSPPVYVPVFEPIPIFVAPVYYQPIPIAGPYFINTFTPNIYCNDFAIAAAAASAYAYGGDAFGVASSLAPFVPGGGGYAFAAAQAAAAAGIGGGGIAVAAASAAAAASGYDVSSAATAISTAVAGGGGASAAASAAAAAASGGADVGGIAAAAAGAGAAATGGDPVLASNRIADRFDTPGAHHAFDAARQARQAGADSKTIAGRIGDAIRGGEQGIAGPEGGTGGRFRSGRGPEAAQGIGTGETGPAAAGPGAARGHRAGGTGAFAGVPGQEHGPGTGGTQPFSAGTSPGQGGSRGHGLERAGTAHQAPISQFGAAAGGGKQAGSGISPGIAHRAEGGAPGQNIAGGAGTARHTPASQFGPAAGGGTQSGGAAGPGAAHRFEGGAQGQSHTPISQFPAVSGRTGGAGTLHSGTGSGQGVAGQHGGTQITGHATTPGGPQGQKTGVTSQHGIKGQSGISPQSLKAPSGGAQHISSGGRSPASFQSSPATGSSHKATGSISQKAPASFQRSGGNVKSQTSHVQSAPVSKPRAQSSGFKAPSTARSPARISAPSGGSHKPASVSSFKAPSSGGTKSSSGSSRHAATVPRSSGKSRR